MPSAVFVEGCNTVHEYKARIAEGSWCEYEIAECYLMKYDKFIWLCNHIHERDSDTTRYGGGATLKAAMLFSTRADKVLLLARDMVAVLYNAGKKVEDFSSRHRARDARAAIVRQRRESLALANHMKSLNSAQNCQLYHFVKTAPNCTISVPKLEIVAKSNLI